MMVRESVVCIWLRACNNNTVHSQIFLLDLREIPHPLMNLLGRLSYVLKSSLIPRFCQQFLSFVSIWSQFLEQQVFHVKKKVIVIIIVDPHDLN